MTAKKGSAIARFFFARSRCLRFSRYQALTDITNAEPIIHAAAMVCRKRGRNDCVQTTDQKSVMKARFPQCEPCTVNPAGVCIQEFAMMIQSALKWAPKVTRNVAPSHMRGPRREEPN